MKDLLKKLNLFFYATNIPLRLYNSDDFQISSNILITQKMPDFLCFEDYERILLDSTRDISQNTCYYTNDLLEHYYSFGFLYEDQEYKIIAGPTIDCYYTNKELTRIMNTKELKLSNFNILNLYFRSLPKYTTYALRRTEPLLRNLCNCTFDISGIIKPEQPQEFIESIGIYSKEVQRYHHSINRDVQIYEAIKNGERERLFNILYTPEDGHEGILCRNDPIRSFKNLFIVTVTQTTKAVIDGGVDSESAYTLSDTFIQTVEEISLYEEITNLFIKMFNAFIDLVEKTKKYKYTNPIYKTIDYINKHYYENISAKVLAANINMSESHLFKLFKEQTGISIKKFIIEKRINEAKSLLKHTKHNLATICEMTGFSDQSHMTKQFRNIVKTTPKKFRNLI